MYNLFLETRAAAQIRQWCMRNAIDDERCEQIIREAYANACNSPMFAKTPGGFDGYLFSKCVKEDDHYRIDIDHAFIWEQTPQGGNFWMTINRENVPVPRGPLA